MPELIQLPAKIARSPWSVVSAVLTFVLSFWGLWKMYGEITQSFGIIWARVVVVILIVAVVIPFGLSFFIQRGIRRFSLPAEERFLFTDIAREWKIAFDGAATVETESNYLFFREPKAEDLFDITFSSEDYDLQSYQLHSPDATGRDQEKLGENLWKVFWKPKKMIQVGKPYHHKFTAQFPAPVNGFTSKSFTIRVSASTIKFHLEIESARPIWKRYVYKKRWWQQLRNHGQIVRTAQRVKRTKAPPLVNPGNNNLVLTIENIGRNDVYYVVLLYRTVAAGEASSKSSSTTSVAKEQTPAEVTSQPAHQDEEWN